MVSSSSKSGTPNSVSYIFWCPNQTTTKFLPDLILARSRSGASNDRVHWVLGWGYRQNTALTTHLRFSSFTTCYLSWHSALLSPTCSQSSLRWDCPVMNPSITWAPLGSTGSPGEDTLLLPGARQATTRHQGQDWLVQIKHLVIILIFVTIFCRLLPALKIHI